MNKNKLLSVLLAFAVSLTSAVVFASPPNFTMDGNRTQLDGLDTEGNVIVPVEREISEEDEYLFVEEEEEEVVGLPVSDLKGAAKLFSLGLIKSIPENGEETVTYSQFAGYMASLMNGTSLIEVEEIDKNRPISVNDAVRMVVTTLGYKVYADKDGGYPMGYIYTASTQRLVPSAYRASNEGQLTAADAFEIIDFMLDVPYLKQVTFGEGDEYIAEKGVTLLSEFHDIHKVEGVLTAVGNRSVFSQDNNPVDIIKVDSIPYYNASISNLVGILGFSITGYYRELSQSDRLMLYAEPQDNNNVLTIEGNWIRNFSDNEISYVPDNGNRVVSVRIPASAHIMFNYRNIAKPSVDDILNASSITFIDNGSGTAQYNVVNIVYEEVVFVSGIDSASNILYGKYGEVMELTANAATVDINVVDTNNNNIFFEDIPVGSVASVYRDKEGMMTDIIVSEERVTGVITEISVTDDLKLRDYFIGEEKYRLASNYARIDNLAVVEVGREVTFFLSAKGKIGGIATKGFAIEKEDYGYLADMFLYNDAMFDSVALLIYSVEGGLKTFYTAEKLFVNDVRTPASNLRNMLERDGTQRLRQLVKYSLDDEGRVNKLEVAERIEEYDFPSIVKSNGRFNRYIDIIGKRDTQPSDVSQILHGETTAFNRDQNSFVGKVRTDYNTLVLFVPTREENLHDERYYHTRTWNEFSSGNYEFAEIYNVRPDMTAGVVVVHTTTGGGTQISKSTRVTFVTDVSEVLHADGTHRIKIKGFRDRNPVEYIGAEEFKNENSYYGESTGIIGYYNIHKSSIARGDLIRVATNRIGEVVDFAKVFDLSDDDNNRYVRMGNEYPDPNETYFGSGRTMISFRGNVEDPTRDITTGRVWQGDNQYWFTGVGYSVEFGIVAEKYAQHMVLDSYPGIAVTNTDTISESARKSKTSRYVKVNAAIFVIDEVNDDYYLGTVNDVIGANNVNFDKSKASRVILGRHNNVATFLAVIKRK